MLASLEGLDHVVVMVRDLDTAAEHWRSLGFTLSPRGTHSPHLGTGNYTIMFQDDYMELLGIVSDTELNAPSRAFLDRRGDGIERVAFTTSDAATGVAALRGRGLAAQGPIEFSRPVELPDGGHGEAAFSVFHWPHDQRPADLRIFACQHHTRGTVWIPSLQSHSNTAVGIIRVELVSQAPEDAAEQLAGLIEGEVQSTGEGARVPTAAGRGDFLFLSHEAFLARHPGTKRETLPDEGVAALVLRVEDIEAAARAAGETASTEAGTVTVSPDRANGVLLVFEGR
jgi:catechol 2,3-dioxygenase-like lactoylglutathione lyase family enzyme